MGEVQGENTQTASCMFKKILEKVLKSGKIMNKVKLLHKTEQSETSRQPAEFYDV